MKNVYACICQDSDAAAELRSEHMSAHLSYIESIMDRVLIAGPLRDEQDQITGSCLIYDTDSQEEAMRLMRADPYHQAGVWSRVDCRQMSLAAGAWIGGARW